MPFFRKGDDYMKAIILYCSRSGNTEALAHRVCQTIPCDTLKVEPKEPYGNYLQSILRVRKERKKNIVPETSTPVPDLSSYDTVFRHTRLFLRIFKSLRLKRKNRHSFFHGDEQ